MSAAALVVEIVLAGLLMLCAMLLPAFDPQALASPAFKDALALIIAVGFVLGVIVDRSADSILARWDGAARIHFALKDELSSRRGALIERGQYRDPFPEELLRLQVLRAEDGIQKWFEQLRVRVRVARSLIVLGPALGTSITFRLLVQEAPAEAWRRWLGAIHLLILLLVVLMTKLDCFEAPSSSQFGNREPSAADYRRWTWLNPTVLWLLLQLAAAGVTVGRLVTAGSGNCLNALASLLVGATLTALAVMTWLRVMKTYRQFLWNYCESTCESALVAALGRAPRPEPSGAGVQSVRNSPAPPPQQGWS